MLSLKTAGATGIIENKEGLTIIKAIYGVQSAFQDVTTGVQALANNGEVNFTVSAQSLGVLDPAPGVKKTFQMQYKINGGNISLLNKDDGEQVVLSVPTVVTKAAALEDIKKAPTFTGTVGNSIWGLVVGFFTISSHWAGSVLLGSPAVGVGFALITLFTHGTFGIFVVPAFIFAYFLFNPNYIPNYNPI